MIEDLFKIDWLRFGVSIVREFRGLFEISLVLPFYDILLFWFYSIGIILIIFVSGYYFMASFDFSEESFFFCIVTSDFDIF